MSAGALGRPPVMQREKVVQENVREFIVEKGMHTRQNMAFHGEAHEVICMGSVVAEKKLVLVQAAMEDKGVKKFQELHRPSPYPFKLE
ncbi:hypothetical protein HHK36_003033 [Tetracentron sinense]|uniref:Uncharacterized protein n=1 Tax=Tetracentron sinense TaxID=13715 RepID=A0A835DNA6_TETSI|nr:hypothetical protein HHK36_003033 [Tetracentron sinense]